MRRSAQAAMIPPGSVRSEPPPTLTCWRGILSFWFGYPQLGFFIHNSSSWIVQPPDLTLEAETRSYQWKRQSSIWMVELIKGMPVPLASQWRALLSRLLWSKQLQSFPCLAWGFQGKSGASMLPSSLLVYTAWKLIPPRWWLFADTFQAPFMAFSHHSLRQMDLHHS